MSGVKSGKSRIRDSEGYNFLDCSGSAGRAEELLPSSALIGRAPALLRRPPAQPPPARKGETTLCCCLWLCAGFEVMAPRLERARPEHAGPPYENGVAAARRGVRRGVVACGER